MSTSEWNSSIIESCETEDTVITSKSDNSFSTVFITLCCSLVVIVLISLRKLSGKNSKGSEDGKGSAIPTYSSFSNGIRLPQLVETMILMTQMRREGTKFLERIHLRYQNDPIVKIPVLQDYVLDIKCPSLIQKILGSSNKDVLQRPRQITECVLPAELWDGILGNNFEDWQAHRKILNKSYNYKSLQSYVRIMNKHSHKLVSDLDKETNGNPAAELGAKKVNELLYFHAFNIISDIIMGEDIFTEEENHNFHHHFVEGKTLVVHRLMNPHNLISLIWWMNPKKKVLDKHLASTMKHVSKAIQRCKDNLNENSNSEKINDQDRETDVSPFRSMVEEMLDNKMAEKEIECEVFTFLVAGHETTVTGIRYFMQHIAEYPEAQVLCQQEIDSIFESKADNNESNTDFSMNDLTNLKYLERCILETVRITPVASPFIFRQLAGPLEVEGYKFKKDTIFMFNSWSIQRDPKVYPNPEVFDPDRFLPENMLKRSSYSFIPFSHGPRNCIGYKMAMMEMKIILAWVMRYFNVSTSDRLEDISIHFDITTAPKRNYNITLTKRGQKNPLALPYLETAHNSKLNLKAGQETLKTLSKETGLTCREVERWLKIRRCLEKPSVLAKFSESGWRLICYTASTIVGLMSLWNKPWFWDLKEELIGYSSYDSSVGTHLYYLYGAGFYSSLFLTQFVDVRRKDFWEMLLHHVLTLSLMITSFTCNLTRVGVVVLILHDSTDIFLEAAKMANYAKKEKLASGIFFAFVFVWVLNRLVIFPYKIILIYNEILSNGFKCGAITLGMLFALFCLNLFWTYFILKLVISELNIYPVEGKQQKDPRSESEYSDGDLDNYPDSD